MNIINVKLENIKPYKNNPRNNKEAIDKVLNSIKLFGFKVPLLIDKDYTIISGHTRYEASKKLGLKEVPCIIIDDLSDKQIKAFRIADNKVAERAEWDWDKLADELNKIELINVEEFGFENIEKGKSLDDFDLSYIADYKIYVKSYDENEIIKAKKIMEEYNGDN